MAKSEVEAAAYIQTLITAATGFSDPGHNVLDSLTNGQFVVTDVLRADLGVFARSDYDCDVTLRCRTFCKVDDWPRYRATLTAAIKTIHATLFQPSNIQLNGTVDFVRSANCQLVENALYGAYPVCGYEYIIEANITRQ